MRHLRKKVDNTKGGGGGSFKSRKLDTSTQKMSITTVICLATFKVILQTKSKMSAHDNEIIFINIMSFVHIQKIGNAAEKQLLSLLVTVRKRHPNSHLKNCPEISKEFELIRSISFDF